MHDLRLPQPRDPANWSRTGFSFTRFAIPELAGYRGRALYLDADMQVFRDIRELWSIPFDGAKVIVQEDIPNAHRKPDKSGAPRQRIKQCSVMLLDCGALDWKVEDIIAGLDGGYDYAQLMNELCILDERDVKYEIPFCWNSLEAFGPDTALIHYTDMGTQPWVSPANPLGYVWLNEVRLMLEAGAIAWESIEQEVARGHFRPSILEELRLPPADAPPGEAERKRFDALDRDAGFVKHAALNAHLDERKQTLAARNESEPAGLATSVAHRAVKAALARATRFLGLN